ncbi:hypothetical protein QTP86_030216, partial [Hemibagrus guttatus]
VSQFTDATRETKEFTVTVLIVMACEQLLRTHQKSSQMLPHVVATEQQSLVVVKKLLAIAVSSITYLRGLFPEKAYGSKYVEEQKVMILREERTCPGASQIVQWLQGCFDAIQKKYLRMILLSMYSDPEYPEKVTECYQFRIQYTEKGPQLDFESKNQKNMTKMDCNDIKKSSILLVRKLYTLMQNLGPLPDSVCLNMKLFYYDDVTPNDYQPPGFKEGENSSLVFQKEPVNLTMGEVVTPFHTLKVDVTTERERLEQVDDEEPICARDRWTINEDEIVCVSEVQHEIVSKENVVIDTGIENSDLSKEDILENSQCMMEQLIGYAGTQQQAAITAALLSPEVRKNARQLDTMGSADISDAEEIVNLKPLKKATTVLSDEKSATLSLIMPLKSMIEQSMTLDEQDSTTVSDMKTVILQNLSSRYIEADSLVKKTSDLSVATRKTRSGRVFNYSDKKDGKVPRTAEKKPVSQFQFPLSQDPLPAAPKRRKFSVPKENH